MLDIHDQLIDPIWAAEFRGFFCGEGYLGISSWGYDPKNDCRKLRPRIQITSRSDESAVLYEFQSRFGGIVYQEHDGRISKGNYGEVYNSKPYTVWRVVKADQLRLILDVLENGVIPFRKREQIQVLREFLTTITHVGQKNTPEIHQKRNRLHQQIKELHKYSE